MLRGRGRRPRRPVRPWASPMSSCGQRRAEDVAPYQVRAWCACADVACVCGHGAVRGRGRRPRRPACPWASPVSSPMSFRGRGAPGTSRRTRCAHGVRADVACVGGHGAGRGRGRRPRRPTCPWACPMASPWARRAVVSSRWLATHSDFAPVVSSINQKKCWGTTLGCQKRVSPPPSVVLDQVN